MIIDLLKPSNTTWNFFIQGYYHLMSPTNYKYKAGKEFSSHLSIFHNSPLTSCYSRCYTYVIRNYSSTTPTNKWPWNPADTYNS